MIVEIVTSSRSVSNADNGKILALNPGVTLTMPNLSAVDDDFRVTVKRATYGGAFPFLQTTGDEPIDSPGPTYAVQGVTNQGGAFCLTTPEQRRITTGRRVKVEGTGVTDGCFNATRDTVNHMTKAILQGTAYASGYAGGGTVTIIRTKLAFRTARSSITLVKGPGYWAVPYCTTDFLDCDVLNDDNTGFTGQGMNNNLAFPIDDWYDFDKRRNHTRSDLLTEIGDTPETAGRRIELASGCYPDGETFTNCKAGTPIYLIHATGSIANGSLHSRSAQIHFRATENLTVTGCGGEAIIATTRNGTAAGCTEAVWVRQDGGLAVGERNGNGKMEVVGGTGHTTDVVFARAKNASYGGAVYRSFADRAPNAAFMHFRAESNNNVVFYVRGDGAVFSDGGTAMNSPADYAEMIREWWDGNPQNEDRRGRAVVLVSKANPNRIARQGSHEDTLLRLASSFHPLKRWLHRRKIVGIVSVDPAIKCRGQAMNWQGKYLRDELGAAIYEDAPTVSWGSREYDPETETWTERDHFYFADEVPEGETVPDDAEHGTAKRKKLNPDYDPSIPNVSREDRPEWDYVGLLGQLPLRDGEPVNPRWVRLGRLTTGVSEWLVR